MSECKHGVPLYGFCAECSREIEKQAKSSASPAGYKPLPGEWRHANGYLINGTFRIARADFDTNPSTEMQNEVFDWIVETLNKAS